MSIKVFFFISFLLLTSTLDASEFNGPLLLNNKFPLFLHLNTPGLESARLENSFSAGLSHSTVYINETSDDWDIGLDIEFTELDFRIRKVVAESIELGADVPFISFNSGIMDSPLRDFHRMFGFPNYGREERPDNDFLYVVRKNGVPMVKSEPGKVGISDIRLSAKKAVFASDPAISLKLGLDLPTGDPKKGYGNGEPGIDFTIMLDKNLGDSFMTYTNAGIAFPGDINGYERIETRSFTYGSFGLEAIPMKNIGILAQLSIQESPYPKTGIRQIDATSVIFTFGGRYNTVAGSFELGFMEDLNATGATDFTTNLSYKTDL